VKAKLLYCIAVGAALVLIAAAAVLTSILFNLSIHDRASGKTPGQEAPLRRRNQVLPVAETIIKVGDSQSREEEIGVSGTSPALSSRRGENHSIRKEPAVGRDLESIGMVVFAYGRTFAVASSERRRPLPANARIRLNERIETDADSGLEIEFGDGTILGLAENTVIIIDDYVYARDKPAANTFVMRINSGACRLRTGEIALLRPGLFRVRARMATIANCGCDIALESKSESDDIYVLGLPWKKGVTIETTTDGSPIMNLVTGEDLPERQSRKRTLHVSAAETLVSVERGQGATRRRTMPGEVTRIVSKTCHIRPLRYEQILVRGESVFRLEPALTQAVQSASAEP